MREAIIYGSVHHGNTKKVVDAIAKDHEVTLINAAETKKADLSEYDLIGFASGIYAGSFHPTVLDFARENLPDGKKVFYIFTSAMSRAGFTKSIDKAVRGKNAAVLGTYFCPGYNTFGPFKLVGGTSKGHPDRRDLENAVAFHEKLLAELGQ